jgi:hypothetical protein
MQTFQSSKGCARFQSFQPFKPFNRSGLPGGGQVATFTRVKPFDAACTPLYTSLQ